MESKYTIRDFMVYALTGIYFMISIAIVMFESIKNIVKYEVIKDNQTLIIFFIIPIAYFLGHIIHGLDTFIMKISKKLKKNDETSKCIECIKSLLKYPIYIPLNYYRVIIQIEKQKLENDKFWQDCNELQLKGKYIYAEYWYTMNDMLKGLTLTSFVMMLICIRNINYIKHGLLYSILFASFTIIFCFRAKFMAENFVNTIKRIKAIENNK